MAPTLRGAFAALALVLSMIAAPASAQIELFVSGRTQGPIEPLPDNGTALERRMLLPIPIQSFALSVSQAYDPNFPGVPVGPRQVSPLSLSKIVDGTTVNFLQALATFEELDTCFLHVFGVDEFGQPQLVLELTLEDAFVMTSNVSSVGDGSPSSEALSIGFSTLDWFNPVTGERYTETMGVSSVAPAPGANLALATTPNPTSGETEFDFRLPASGQVTIDVFDFRGRRVATVFDGEAGSTAGTVSWDGRDTTGRPVASGVYLVKMRAGSWLTTHKMSVLR